MNKIKTNLICEKFSIRFETKMIEKQDKITREVEKGIYG